MTFMHRQTAFISAWHIETSSGTECIPCDVAGATNLPCDLTLQACLPYLEGTPLQPEPTGFGDGIDKHTGWYARLSAPGFMDCTEWSGPFKTEARARTALAELYGDWNK